MNNKNSMGQLLTDAREASTKTDKVSNAFLDEGRRGGIFLKCEVFEARRGDKTGRH